SRQLASGVILAAGTLGQIIPPSIVLVVLADQLEVSAGSLFMGGLVPGLLLASLYAAYAVAVAFWKPEVAPALHVEPGRAGLKALAVEVVAALFPPLLLILLVLGSIFAGVATPTEAGALGSVGALVLAAVRRRLRLEVLRTAALENGKLTTMVVFLLIGSTMFALV